MPLLNQTTEENSLQDLCRALLNKIDHEKFKAAAQAYDDNVFMYAFLQAMDQSEAFNAHSVLKVQVLDAATAFLNAPTDENAQNNFKEHMLKLQKHPNISVKYIGITMLVLGITLTIISICALGISMPGFAIPAGIAIGGVVAGGSLVAAGSLSLFFNKTKPTTLSATMDTLYHNIKK